VYPHIKSSEGIVNGNWYDTIRSRNIIDCHLLSSHQTITVTKQNNQDAFQTETSPALVLLYESQTGKKSAVRNFLYRAVNFAFTTIQSIPLYQFLWTRIQKTNLLKALATKKQVVVWGRILPTFSILPVVEAYAKIPFPFVVNINDPLSTVSGFLTEEEKMLIQTKDTAACWTFPSHALAKTMSQNYGLDAERCFVIPHAMRDQNVIYNPDTAADRKLKIVYTGTFYKSAFTENFAKDLLRFSSSENAAAVDFIFILSQYDAASLDWIRKNVPTAQLHFQLSREEVLEITAGADCMLIVDSAAHHNLLKGKLIEAISQGLPVLAVTYPQSVMEKVTNEYGGFVVYQEEENAIYQTLTDVIRQLRDEKWHEQFSNKKKAVMEKIAERNILALSEKVAQFAWEHFLWRQGKRNEKPQIPQNVNWP